VTRQSAHAGAGWIVAKAPIRAGHVVRGIQWAVMTRFVLLPLAFFGVLVFRRHSWHLAALFVLAGLSVARLVVAAAFAFRPSYPLGEPPAVAGAVAQLGGWALGTAGAVAYIVAALIADALGVLGTVLVGLAAAGAFGLSIAAQAIAAHRLGRLEQAL
jgi:hypothetical protein